MAVSPIVDRDGENKNFAALISEIVGTFFFVFLFALATDPKTQFSKDKVINCFIIASSYCASRLMAGGTLVTGLNLSAYETHEVDGATEVISCDSKNITHFYYRLTGPLLNPALAFG